MKMFLLADPNGVILDFCPYIGSKTFDDLSKDIGCMGLGASAVISLTASTLPGTKLKFDRYFSSKKLLAYFLQINASGTRTIIKTRLPYNISFQDDNTMMKNTGRGVYETFKHQDKKKRRAQNGWTTSLSTSCQLLIQPFL